jgi:hypothetical protein
VPPRERAADPDVTVLIVDSDRIVGDERVPRSSPRAYDRGLSHVPAPEAIDVF